MDKLRAASEKPYSSRFPTELMPERDSFRPSSFVRKFSARVAQAAAGKPILDVGCGSGRNAVPFLQLGCTVICLDKNLSSLNIDLLTLACQDPATQLVTKRLDLVSDAWPYEQYSIGGIISVHLDLPMLLPIFATSLSAGGYLLLESVPAYGGNYLELPKRGELKARLGRTFNVELYKEGKAGPRGYDAATVRLLARRRQSASS